MKALALMLGLLLVACATSAFAQGTPMYDSNYTGPMNVYGQPTYTVPGGQQPGGQQPGGQQPAQAGPYPQNGVIPLAAQGAYSIGSYLWSYMPAPLRGEESPYTVPPGSGQVIVNFVPGTR